MPNIIEINDFSDPALDVYARATEKIFGTLPKTAIYSLPMGKLLFENN